MEINVTRFFTFAAPMDYSASVAEIGNDAGPSTWRAACEDADDYNMLDTDEKREEFKRYIKAFGAWDDEEIAAMNDNALFIQMIAGDMREAGLDGDDRFSLDAWKQYEDAAERGQCSGNLFRSDEGEVFYYVGY